MRRSILVAVMLIGSKVTNLCSCFVLSACLQQSRELYATFGSCQQVDFDDSTDAEPNDAQKQEAIALIRAGLGEAEIRIAASYTTPFFWTLRKSNGDEMMKGGSAFFIDTGECVFAITASHVVEECLEDTKSRTFIQCMLGTGRGMPSVPFHLGDRLIDAHRGIDIATFWMKPEEIRQTGREVLQGYYHPRWPPPLPQKDRGVTYCGFPARGRRWLAPREISFGRAALGGIATNSHELSLSILIEREHLFQVLGDEAMPENYDFGGISGGPVIAIVQTPQFGRGCQLE